MASNATIVKEMMDEFGKSSPEVQRRIQRVVDEVTIDILSNNEGRFRRLAKTATITVTSASKQYRLPHDFNTAKNYFNELDSDGEFVAERSIVSESMFYQRKGDADYTGSMWAMIETLQDHADGPGEYLILNALPDDTGYYKFPYYRKPVKNDTDIITNVRVVKSGVRAAFPNLSLMLRPNWSSTRR